MAVNRHMLNPALGIKAERLHPKHSVCREIRFVSLRLMDSGFAESTLPRRVSIRAPTGSHFGGVAQRQGRVVSVGGVTAYIDYCGKAAACCEWMCHPHPSRTTNFTSSQDYIHFRQCRHLISTTYNRVEGKGYNQSICYDIYI